ncbi:hypothetical protein [Streptomyces somaliensis]|uniref:hypothetical protein n=1 Tax=Streptomyces somaliensis TaxID=78355 RepID=UPI0027E3ED21|nr:hypothetical protein [Streptomyces somaliensis]
MRRRLLGLRICRGGRPRLIRPGVPEGRPEAGQQGDELPDLLVVPVPQAVREQVRGTPPEVVQDAAARRG